jgi:hypothetical protein
VSAADPVRRLAGSRQLRRVAAALPETLVFLTG